jgi:hypothetical protein
MFKKRYVLGLMITAFLLGASSSYILYTRYTPMEKPHNPQNSQIKKQRPDTDTYDKEPNLDMSKENLPTARVEIAKITPSTKMVYQYYYEQDQKVVEEEAEPPYFLLDFTREELQEKFKDWQIDSFSNQKVVMQKKVQEKSPYHFRIGIYKGYVAVFYDNDTDQPELRELTETPASSLPEQERKKLEKGISVYGEDELVRILQDYNS